jgi:hypothetical protein
MLIAVRSSQDFACCLRATASARLKQASAFAASRAISGPHPAECLIEGLGPLRGQPACEVGHEPLDDLAGRIIDPLDVIEAGGLIA